MRKKTRKLLSLIMAATMSVSAFGGLSALADSVTFDLDETDNTARTATLIKATYDGDKLSNVAIIDKNVAIAAEQPTYTYDNAEAGAKYFLWDMAEGKLTPLAKAVETTPDPNATPKPTPEATPASTPGTEVTPTSSPGTEVTPTTDPNATPSPEPEGLIKYDFGSADNTAEGYIAVPADKKYTAADGYGFIGLENGFSQDKRIDGWEMTRGYDLVLENGANETVATAGDDWVATTTREEKGQEYISPIRFAKRVDTNTYYKVKVNLRRADVTKEAYVNLFTEKRHQHLVEEPIPAEGLTYECSVYVHNNWSKNTKEYVDNMLNIVAEGDNVAISSIEILPTEQGKTLWVLTDSTGCEQSAPIPYFALDHCQGIGSAMARYLPEDWALVNEGESGLASTDSVNHFKNMINDVKPGDIVWFEFGHNNTRSTGIDGLISSLNGFYNGTQDYKGVKEQGANFLVVSPVERDTTNQFKDGVWTETLKAYGDAGENWVEQQIEAGNTDVAYLDLNTASLDFLNKVQAEIDAGRKAASTEEKPLASLGAATTRFYYYVSKYAGYIQDYTHPNDYGADNFAKIVVDLAKEKMAAAAESDSVSLQTQAAVLEPLFGSTRDFEAVSVPKEVYLAGAAPNSYYPNQLAQVILYEYPIIVSSVTFDEDKHTPAEMNVKLVASNVEYKYGRGVIVVYDKDGSVKGTVKTINAIDSVAAETQTITFAESDVTFDAAAGDTFKAYVINITEGADSHDEDDVIISTTYTQNDMIDVENYLLQGAIGDENKEDFSTYDLMEGESIIGKNGWTNPGGETFAYGEENGLSYAHCVTTGGATYYPEKKFTAVSSGQLYCRLDVRYISGVFNLYFTDGTALNSWPAGRIMPLQITTEGGVVQVKFNGKNVATVNSGEWVTYALTIDFDYGKYYLSLNGQTYESDFTQYNSNETTLVPSNLSMIAFQNDKDSNEYDITNIVLAKLKTNPLPSKTLKVSSEDTNKGTVSIINGTETITTGSAEVTMNSIIKAKAEAKPGYEFAEWTDKEGNAISYAPEYEMRLHNDTELIAKFQVEVVDPITYAYKETFSTLSTSTLAADGWLSVNAQGSTTVEQDSEHGNYLQMAPGQDNSRGLIKNFGIDNLTDDYVVEMDLLLKAGTNQDTSFSIFNGASTNSYYKNNDQAMNNAANGYIFSLGTTNSINWTINGTTETVEIPNDTWVHLMLVMDNGIVTYTITNGSKTLKTGTATPVIPGDAKNEDGKTAVGGIHLRQGRYQGVTKMDNIRVYTSDQLQ